MKSHITIITDKRVKEFQSLYGYTRHSSTFMGNFGFNKPQYREFELIELSDWDKSQFADAIQSLKPQERMYRYESRNTRIAGLTPLIKINIVKGLVYFLVSGATDATFETRGEKVNWLNVYDKPELVEALLDATPHRWVENWEVIHYHDPIVHDGTLKAGNYNIISGWKHNGKYYQSSNSGAPFKDETMGVFDANR